MKEQFQNATEWIKNQPDIKGCITGSTMLKIFENDGKNIQDLDIFLYTEKSFTELFYTMLHDPMFQILEPVEQWKADKFRTQPGDFYRYGLITIKFTYNTAIPINIILKKNCTNIFSVLSSFDMDIITKGYCLETKQVLDLSQHLPDNKVNFNNWNPAFHSDELWKVSRVLRQISRVFKYHRRGYNCDLMVLKYIELLDIVLKKQDIFNSTNFTERLKITKENTKIVKKICQVWLETHEITEEQEELLQLKIKEI